jgi:hypothetical protein
MSFSNNIAARGGLHGWIRAGGYNRGGISRAGKIYLPSEPAPNPEGLAVAAVAHPSDSKNLPAPGATSGSGHFAQGYECRCGRQKLPKHLVCHSCWHAAPDSLRKDLRFGNQPTRRAAMRLLLEAASARRAIRELAKEKYA